MGKFYAALWIKWVGRVSIGSVGFALAFSLAITVFSYVSQDSPPLNAEIYDALFEITKFWFPIVWSLTLLLSLFRSLKHIFNSCNGGYELKLLDCKSNEAIEEIGYGDLIKVWRKWFALIIWLSGAQMIFAVAFTYSLTNLEGVFSWFNVYWLFGFVAVSGYFSFAFLASRCKSVKITKC